MRVVDDRTNGNIGFLKAVARTLVKSVLGIYSFITMGTTLRHQALHDVLTRSTVQIRNLARAKEFHYRAERTIVGVPSRTRRASVIVLYLIVLYVLVGIVDVFLPAGCFARGVCSAAAHFWTYTLILAWLGLSVLCIIYGWLGRLYGCRWTEAPTDQPRHIVLNRSTAVASTSSPGRPHQSSEKISTSWMPR
jgi:hypothetical protein